MLIEVTGLTKRYGEQLALSNVTFSVRPGEILGLVGPNGAGKTTLLETIAGILPADAGCILWRGAWLPPRRRRDVMYYLPDGVRPWHDQYVLRVLAFHSSVYRKPQAETDEIVAMTGLGRVLHKRVIALSKGYLRRLMWALALLAPHPLLLLDEPFDGFDLKQTREMTSVLRALPARGRTLILSIHQLSDAERVCDRFVFLAGGQVHGHGTVEELRHRAGLVEGGLEEAFLALT